MAYWAGIDLGTTFTAAAVMVGDRPEMITLSSTSTSIPSVVALKADGTWLVGRSASQRASTEPDRVAREFKRRIGDPVPILVGGTPFPAQDLSTVLLEKVLEIVESRMGSAPTGIAVTHPASWGPYRLDVFRAAIKSVSPYPVTFVSEPLGAAVHYSVKEKIDEGEIVCVYDLGGGTFDTALLQRTADGFSQIGEPLGLDQFGGIDIDAALRGMVINALPRELADLDPDNPAVIAGYSSLKKQLAPAKIALSSDTDTSIAINLPDYSSSVRVNRNEFEAAIRPRLEQTIDVVGDMIARASLTPADINRILLVGGSSRIPLVSQLLMERLGRPISVDADPKHSIVLGAVALASGHASSPPKSSPAPAVPPSPTTTQTPPPAQTPPPTPAAPPEEKKAVGSLFPDLPDGPLPGGELPFGRKAPTSTSSAPPSNASVAAPPPSQPVSAPPAPTSIPQAAPEPPPTVANPVTTAPHTPAQIPQAAAPMPQGAAPPAVGQAQYSETVEQKSGKAKFVLLGILLLGAIGGGAYALVTQLGDNQDTATTDTTSITSPVSTEATSGTDPEDSTTAPPTAPAERASIEVLETVAVGSKPWKPGIVDGRVFISVSGEDKVKVYDSLSYELIGEILVGDSPASPVVSPGKVWVLNAGSNTVSMINSQSLVVEGTIPVGTSPNNALVAGGRLWVSNQGSGNMTIIELASGAVVDTIAIGTTPGRGAIVNNSIYVSAQGDDLVVAVDMGDLSTTTISVGDEPLNVLSGSDLVWVANLRDQSVSVIDPATNSVVKTIPVGNLPLPGIEAGGLIWIPNRGSDTMSIIDPATLEVLNVIDTGSKPGTPMATKGRVFVSNFGSGDVTIIDVPAQTVVGTLPVGAEPDTAALDDNNQLWIVAIDGGTATVLRPG